MERKMGYGRTKGAVVLQQRRGRSSVNPDGRRTNAARALALPKEEGLQLRRQSAGRARLGALLAAVVVQNLLGYFPACETTPRHVAPPRWPKGRGNHHRERLNGRQVFALIPLNISARTADQYESEGTEKTFLQKEE